MSGCGIGSGKPGLTRISEDELAGLDRPSLARQRLDAAALDRRLVDAVFVTQRIEVARLRAEILHGQNADAREALILLASDGEDAAPIFLGIAECAHADVDLTFAERRVPVLRIVDALVAELPGARRHPFAKSLGKALQRILGKAERLKAGIADPDRKPGIGRSPPTRGGIDVRCQPAKKLATRLSIVDAQEHVSAEVRRGPRPENGRLDLVQVERRRTRHNIRGCGSLTDDMAFSFTDPCSFRFDHEPTDPPGD